MRDFTFHKLLSLALAASFSTPAALAAPPAAPQNQRDLQLLSRQVNDRGSDESLKNSALYAMQALMDLNATKLPAAMKNGYQAYGKYRNSENLDRMKDLNALNVNSLASIDAGTTPLPTKTVTSYRRLDPSFLTQGEAGKIAAEFERQSGMKRGDFLTAMAEASEKKISRHDPQMIDKAFGRLEHFIDKIPNKDFRANLEKNLHVVPETMRRGIVAQAVTKLAGFFADAGSAAAMMNLAGGDSNITDKTGASAPSLTASSAAPSAVAAADERKPAGAEAATPADTLAPTPAVSKGGKNPALASVVLTAIKEQKQDVVPSSITGTEEKTELSADSATGADLTIFQQVTKKIRTLTPSLAKNP